MIFNLGSCRSSWIGSTFDWFGLLAIAVNVKLRILCYIFFRGSYQRLTPSRLVRGPVGFTVRAGTYRYLRGRTQTSYACGPCRVKLGMTISPT